MVLRCGCVCLVSGCRCGCFVARERRGGEARLKIPKRNEVNSNKMFREKEVFEGGKKCDFNL